MKKYLCVLVLIASSILRADPDNLVLVGQPAPAISGSTTDGSNWTLESFRGKVVLVNFFAISSGPSMTVLSQIENDIWIPLKDQGLAMIAVGRENTVAQLVALKKEKGFTFLIAADPKREIYSRYATGAVPRCYLIGKDGLVKFASYGYNYWEFEHLKEAIARELKQKGNSHTL